MCSVLDLAVFIPRVRLLLPTCGDKWCVWGDFLESGSETGRESVGVDVHLVSVGRRLSASAGMLATVTRGWVARFATVEPRLVYLSASYFGAPARQTILPFFFSFLSFVRAVSEMRMVFKTW